MNHVQRIEFFAAVEAKQEREAREHGYGKRHTTRDAILEASEALQGSEHGSILALLLDGISGLVGDSRDTVSAVMAPEDGAHGASFILEVSDMDIIERYRVSVQRTA